MDRIFTPPRPSGQGPRKQIKAQLQYIRRDLRYVDELLSQGGEARAHLTEWQINRLAVVRKVFTSNKDTCTTTRLIVFLTGLSASVSRIFTRLFAVKLGTR